MLEARANVSLKLSSFTFLKSGQAKCYCLVYTICQLFSATSVPNRGILYPIDNNCWFAGIFKVILGMICNSLIYEIHSIYREWGRWKHSHYSYICMNFRAIKFKYPSELCASKATYTPALPPHVFKLKGPGCFIKHVVLLKNHIHLNTLSNTSRPNNGVWVSAEQQL